MTEFSVENIYYLGPDGSNAHSAMLKFLQKCNINAKNLKPQKGNKPTPKGGNNKKAAPQKSAGTNKQKTFKKYRGTV